MRAPRSAPALCAALALAPLVLPGTFRPLAPGDAQDGAQEKAPSKSDEFRALREKEVARITDAIEGTWQLLRYDDPALAIAPDDVRGYAIFRDGYMSLTLQAQRQAHSVLGGPYVFPFQATIQQYRIEPEAMLLTSNLIGLGDFGGSIDAEPPGTPHRFDVEVGDKGLVLKRRNGGRLIFQRMEPNAAFPKKAQDKIQADGLNR